MNAVVHCILDSPEKCNEIRIDLTEEPPETSGEEVKSLAQIPIDTGVLRDILQKAEKIKRSQLIKCRQGLN